MIQDISCAVDSYSAAQKIPYLLWNSKFRYGVQRSIIRRSKHRFSMWPLQLKLPNQISAHISYFPIQATCTTCLMIS